MFSNSWLLRRGNLSWFSADRKHMVCVIVRATGGKTYKGASWGRAAAAHRGMPKTKWWQQGYLREWKYLRQTKNSCCHVDGTTKLSMRKNNCKYKNTDGTIEGNIRNQKLWCNSTNLRHTVHEIRIWCTWVNALKVDIKNCFLLTHSVVVYLICPHLLCQRRPASPLDFWPWWQLLPVKPSKSVSKIWGQPSILWAATQEEIWWGDICKHSLTLMATALSFCTGNTLWITTGLGG